MTWVTLYSEYSFEHTTLGIPLKGMKVKEDSGLSSSWDGNSMGHNYSGATNGWQ